MFTFKKNVWIWQQLKLVIFVLTVITDFSISAYVIKSPYCGLSLASSDIYERIVGGTDAKPGEFPWMVSLRETIMDRNGNEILDRFEHACGAVILNENWIVTAAHCLDFPDDASRYEIFVGLHKLSREKDATVKKYKISKIVVHDKYDDETLENDIALLKTNQPIDISGSKGYINSICLYNYKQDPGGYAEVIGWGHTRPDGSNSDTLKKVLIPIIPRHLCAETYGSDALIETMFCAGITGRDSCQNDSGGPLIQTNKNGVSFLIGIVSYGTGCGQKYFPGIYTKVSMFQSWMNKVMQCK